MDRLPKKKAYDAHVILEDLGDGTYICLKNRSGEVGETITQKEITKFMLRL